MRINNSLCKYRDIVSTYMYVLYIGLLTIEISETASLWLSFITELDTNQDIILRKKSGKLDFWLKDQRELFLSKYPIYVCNYVETSPQLVNLNCSAIKCPSIQYHLAGTKKVQQTLARPGTLERFIKDPEKVGKVREIFTGLYSLDFDEFGEQAVKMAMDNAERYVNILRIFWTLLNLHKVISLGKSYLPIRFTRISQWFILYVDLYWNLSEKEAVIIFMELTSRQHYSALETLRNAPLTFWWNGYLRRFVPAI